MKSFMLYVTAARTPTQTRVRVCRPANLAFRTKNASMAVDRLESASSAKPPEKDVARTRSNMVKTTFICGAFLLALLVGQAAFAQTLLFEGESVIPGDGRGAIDNA